MIHRAMPGDLRGVLRLARAAFMDRDDKPTAKWFLDVLARPGAQLWIDTDSDESLRAFLLFYLTTEGTEVKMVATAVFARGKGIARDLLRQVVGPAQTWIRVENKPSQALFSSSGWVYAYVADGWQRWVLTGEE